MHSQERRPAMRFSRIKIQDEKVRASLDKALEDSRFWSLVIVVVAQEKGKEKVRKKMRKRK